MNWLKFTRAVLLLAIPAAANSTPPAAAPVWEVNWGDQFCTLIRCPDSGNSLIVGFRVLPGSETSAIVLMTQGPEGLPFGVNRIVFAPSGRSFDVVGREEDRRNGGHALMLFGLDREFWDALVVAGELQLAAGDQVRRHVVLADTRAAVRALRACASDALREWGVDEAALNALQQPPRSTNNMGLSNFDYPETALRQGRQGRVVVRVTVSADGQATACAPVATSRLASIDSATCNAIFRRGRFTPALGADGRPTAAQTVMVASFLSSDD